MSTGVFAALTPQNRPLDFQKTPKKIEVELLATNQTLQLFDARLRPGQFGDGSRGSLGGRSRAGQGGPRRIAGRHLPPQPLLGSAPTVQTGCAMATPRPTPFIQ